MEGVQGRTPSEFNIRAGSTDRGAGGQLLTITNFFKNPNYNPETLDYDFAILKLARAISLDGTTTKIIPLPVANNPINPGSQTLISGWGRDPVDSPRKLRAVMIPTISNPDCQRQYGSRPITARMICAKAAGKDACAVRTFI